MRIAPVEIIKNDSLNIFTGAIKKELDNQNFVSKNLTDWSAYKIT